MNPAQDFLDLRPSGGFGLIMADPPWSFDNWSARGEAKSPKAHYACAGKFDRFASEGAEGVT